MSNKQYVDDFAAPLFSEFEKLKKRLLEVLEANERLRQNQVKLNEQTEIEMEKKSALEMENTVKDATIRELRKEIERLTQQQEQPSETTPVTRNSVKRKQAATTESNPKMARVMRTRKGVKNQQPSAIEETATPPPLVPVMSFRYISCVLS